MTIPMNIKQAILPTLITASWFTIIAITCIVVVKPTLGPTATVPLITATGILTTSTTAYIGLLLIEKVART